MTATAQYADVVLPAATFLEKDGVRSWWVPLQTINKAVTVDDCKPDVEINFELARRFDPDLKWKSIEELFDDIIKPSGFTYKELQAQTWAYPPVGHPSRPYHRLRRDCSVRISVRGSIRRAASSSFTRPSARGGASNPCRTTKSRPLPR